MRHDTPNGSVNGPARPAANDGGVGRPARSNRSLSRRVVTGTLWSMLGIAALGLTRLAYNALIGRTGDPSRLAEVNAAVSLAFVLTFFTAAATAAAATKFISLSLAQGGSAAAAAVRRKLAWWTVVGSVVAIAALLLVGRQVLPGASFADLGWVSALVVAYGAYTFTKAVLYAYDRAGRYAVLELVSDGAVLTLTVIAVLWLPSVLLAPLVVGYAGFAVAAHLSMPRTGPAEPAPAGTGPGRELWGFVAYTALGITASQGLFQLSMVIARNLTGGDQAGAYAAAMSLVTPAFFLPRALALAFFPAAARAVGTGDVGALARSTESSTRLLALLALPCFTIAAMLGGPALGLVFGGEYAVGGTAFAVLVAAVFGYVVAVPSVNALSAHELALAKVPPLSSAAGVIVAAAVWLAGWLFAGAPTATLVATGYLAAMVVQAGVPMVVASRQLGIAPGRSAARLGGTAVAAAALAATVLLVDRWWVTLAGGLAFVLAYALVHRGDLVRTARQSRAVLTRRDG